MQNDSTRWHVILSGCSGGGKSTLLEELEGRGFPAVAEPGRRIVESGMRGKGKALPWVDLEAFARCAIDLASQDRQRMRAVQGWVFFDRSLVDAAVALEQATGDPVSETLQRTDRYHRQVFMTPPWPEIFSTDRERQHGFEDGVAEYDRLLAAFHVLGYETILLPKVDVVTRADFLLDSLH